MNTELLCVLAMLLLCIGCFAANKPRADVVALLMLVLFPLTGVLDLQQTLAGFSDPAVILIAALFVIGDALVRTGIVYHLGDALVRVAANSETRLLVLLMLAVALLGSVMSSTGVVAIFIPVVLSICARLNIAPGRLMMPLAFAALLIGIALAGTTLVGQSIGAGDPEWARRVGNAIIVLTIAFMGTLGVLVALSGPWLLPTFMNAADPQTADIVEIGIVLLWCMPDDARSTTG